MNLLIRGLRSLALRETIGARQIHMPNITIPKPGKDKAYRRIVHYPENYTVEPLKTTNLGGRDPVTGRVVVGTLGGGIKHPYHWIKWKRDGPVDGPPRVEKVLEIIEDDNRTGHIALVGVDEEIKYIIATENMKPGDLIKTSRHLPRIPVLTNEGDAYVLGAMPNGTVIHSIERVPGMGGFFVHGAGTSATILRREGSRVIVKMPSKKDMSFDQHCMAVVGRVSNAIHSSIPIGSAQRLRWLGYRPRSGLWHRKEGKHGRKIKPHRAPKIMGVLKPKTTVLTLNMYV